MLLENDLKAPGSRGGYEPCEACGTMLDTQQRYCVNCGTRRANGANPSSRYFAAMSKKARRPLTARATKPTPTSRAAAVGFFALLPIAVALGVVVGRSNSGGNEDAALLKALRNQEVAAASSTPAAGATSKTAAANSKESKKEKQALKADEKNGGKVLEKTKNGVVRQVTGYHPTKQETEEDTKIVDQNPEEVGKNYIKAQQNLPNVVVVGGEAGSSPAPSGKGGSEP